MSESHVSYLDCSVVEDEVQFSLVELSRAARAPEEQIHVWVVEGVLEPLGAAPDEWRFGGQALRRARTAARLTRDLELNAAGVALALDLMEQIGSLQARLRQVGRSY